jgi:hypothetical protein
MTTKRPNPDMTEPSRTLSIPYHFAQDLLGNGLILLPILLTSFMAAQAPATQFYVSPDGNDANPGTQAKPLATIAAARDAVRALISAGLTENVTVQLGGGTYRIQEPVVFGCLDAGSDRFSVTYAAAPGEKPVISGGLPIKGWKANSDGTWSTTVPGVAQGKLDFRELYVAGRHAERARHPNQGFFRVEKVGQDRRTNFRFKPGDLNDCPDLQNVELVFLHDWSITRVPVKAIDEATRTLTVTHQVGGPSSWALMDHFEKQPRYFLENSATFLDAPGEWFLDRRSGVLTYRPRAGETINSVEVIVPVARQLLVVSGDPNEGRSVCNLHFTGLDLRHAAWFPAGGVYWGRQACTYWTPQPSKPGQSHEEADPAAVQFELADSCSFTNGRVEHVDTSAICFGRGCRDCRLTGNVVSDVGGNGIMIGEGQARKVGETTWWETAPEQAATGNTAANNLVELCGRELFGAVGIWMGLAAKTTIANNEVRNQPYTGVSIGWMWWNPRTRPEPRSTPCRETMIVDNHIHHTMGILSDGGCIYCLGNQPGSALRGNLIHDVAANAGRAESNGMFLDQGTGGFVIEENVIYNVAKSPLRFHKGWKNLVRNNVLEIGPEIPPVRYNDTLDERIRLENNTVVQKVPAEVIKKSQLRAGRK